MQILAMTTFRSIDRALFIAARVTLQTALVFAALGPLAPAFAQTAAPILMSTALRTDGAIAPIAVANARGYFRTEGVSVTLDNSVNSATALRRVASGERDMALVDMTALIRYREQPDAAPIKAVFVFYNQTPYAIVARKSRGISGFASLEGKKLGVTEGEPVAQQWPAFAKQQGVDTAKIQIEKIGAAVREPMLSAGQLDAVTGFSFATAVDLKDRGIPASDLAVLRFSDFGSALYGHAIVVNPKLAAERPDHVKAVLRGLVNGFKFTLRDPGKAIDDVLPLMEGGSRDLELERLRTVIRDNILTDEVRRMGLGTVDPQRLAKAILEVEPAQKTASRVTPEALFDDSFLPQAASLKVQAAPSR
jgi:NitT/TauT family transport system substrate-binding protein